MRLVADRRRPSTFCRSASSPHPFRRLGLAARHSGGRRLVLTPARGGVLRVVRVRKVRHPHALWARAALDAMKAWL